MNRPRKPLGLASRIWEFIEEPKSVTLVQAIIVYIASIAGGVLTLIYPPNTTSIILGTHIVTAMAILMILGGTIGSVTSISGWWWVERPLGVGLLTLAVCLYLYSVIEAQVLGEGQRYLQMTVIMIALGGLFARWLRIRKHNYDPVA